MARKKAPEKPANHERWLVSYGDFITLLFAVFVTLYAMSQVDKKRVEEVAASYRQAFGVTTGTPQGKMEVIPKTEPLPLPMIRPQSQNPPREKTDKRQTQVLAGRTEFRAILLTLEKYLIEQKAEDKVSVAITRRGLVISLKEAGCFDSGSAAIKPDAAELLNHLAEVLLPYSNPISFEGHTDNVPIRSPNFPTNWELSSARAISLGRYFIDQQGVSPERISVTGYGEHRPVADNTTEEGRRQNRRVDLVLLAVAADEAEGQIFQRPMPSPPGLAPPL